MKKSQALRFIAGLKFRQKQFKEKVLDDRRFVWGSRGLYGATIIYAGYLFMQSVPYYQAIYAGDRAYKYGHYQTARVYFEHALAECRGFYGTASGTSNENQKEYENRWQSDQRSIRAMNNLAEDYRALGLYSQAEPYYEKTVTFARKKFAPSRPEVSIALNNLGMLQRQEGHYAEAEKSYNEALELWQTKVKQKDPKLANILNGLAKLRQDQGRYEEARALYEKALAVNEAALGKRDIANSYILSNLGGLHCDLGHYVEAEALFRRALYLDKNGLGENHPDLASDLHDLGYLLRLQGKLREAKPLYERALEIRIATLGPEHALTAKCYCGLADIARIEGDHDGAETLIKKAKNIQITALGPNHPSLADSLDIEGLNYLDQQKTSEANSCFTAAGAIRHGLLSENHPDVLTSNFYLALCRSGAGEVDEVTLKESFEALSRSLGVNHPTVITARQKLSWKPSSS